MLIAFKTDDLITSEDLDFCSVAFLSRAIIINAFSTKYIFLIFKKIIELPKPLNYKKSNFNRI